MRALVPAAAQPPRVRTGHSTRGGRGRPRVRPPRRPGRRTRGSRARAAGRPAGVGSRSPTPRSPGRTRSSHGTHVRRHERVGAGEQHDLADRDRRVVACGGERDRPAPAPVAALGGGEVVGDGVGCLRDGFQVLADGPRGGLSPRGPRRPPRQLRPGPAPPRPRAVAGGSRVDTAFTARIVPPSCAMTFGRALRRRRLRWRSPGAPPRRRTRPQASERLRPAVLAELPHDTDGVHAGPRARPDGALYEGTGLAGRSQLRELDPATGAVRREVPLPGRLFGEGITVVDDRIWQLTWQRRRGARVGPRRTRRCCRQVPIEGEGWGLCRDGDRLVRSDGTDRLRFHDPESFAETGSVAVTLDGEPVTELNELECVEGQVWANIWQTDRIVRIDPADGRVTAVVDAAGLLDRRAPRGRRRAQRHRRARRRRIPLDGQALACLVPGAIHPCVRDRDRGPGVAGPMSQNGAVARPESPQSRRGHRGRRTWVSVDEDRTPPADDPGTDRYAPRRRYPWHDDPDYDPAAHRRTPPPRPWSTAAPAGPRPTRPPRPSRACCGDHRAAHAADAAQAHRHTGRRAAQPRADPGRHPRVPPRHHGRRGRPLRPHRADLRHDDELRGRRRRGRRAGQHAVLRRRHGGEQDERRALPDHHRGAVRGGGAGDRADARPVAARPPRRARRLRSPDGRCWPSSWRSTTTTGCSTPPRSGRWC